LDDRLYAVAPVKANDQIQPLFAAAQFIKNFLTAQVIFNRYIDRNVVEKLPKAGSVGRAAG